MSLGATEHEHQMPKITEENPRALEALKPLQKQLCRCTIGYKVWILVVAWTMQPIHTHSEHLK